MNQSDFSKALLATESVGTVQSQAWPKSIPAGNRSGFSALPGGGVYDGVYKGLGSENSNAAEARFWLTKDLEGSNGFGGSAVLLSSKDYEYFGQFRTNALSVRCVRNVEVEED
ncbi:MAG: hypothetical protein GX801_11555 [Fibrobacter sp.]|nr:hypothetical protein [Fibrobacter sp.]